MNSNLDLVYERLYRGQLQTRSPHRVAKLPWGMRHPNVTEDRVEGEQVYSPPSGSEEREMGSQTKGLWASAR